ncbi:MAG: hypothetical protein K0S32_782 [Bacteroidetes bacterium]|nr:hypothetical protein [Bacteroidota bacterium]
MPRLMRISRINVNYILAKLFINRHWNMNFKKKEFNMKEKSFIR